MSWQWLMSFKLRETWEWFMNLRSKLSCHLLVSNAYWTYQVLTTRFTRRWQQSVPATCWTTKLSELSSCLKRTSWRSVKSSRQSLECPSSGEMSRSRNVSDSSLLMLNMPSTMTTLMTGHVTFLINRDRWFLLEWHQQNSNFQQALKVFGAEQAHRSGPIPPRAQPDRLLHLWRRKHQSAHLQTGKQNEQNHNRILPKTVPQIWQVFIPEREPDALLG